jgi:hypothetical protein
MQRGRISSVELGATSYGTVKEAKTGPDDCKVMGRGKSFRPIPSWLVSNFMHNLEAAQPRHGFSADLSRTGHPPDPDEEKHTGRSMYF